MESSSEPSDIESDCSSESASTNTTGNAHAVLRGDTSESDVSDAQDALEIIEPAMRDITAVHSSAESVSLIFRKYN